MKSTWWAFLGAIFLGVAFLCSPDVSQAQQGSSGQGQSSGPASTVNPPGLEPFPPGHTLNPPALYPPFPPGWGGIPLGQRNDFLPPGQVRTPPGDGVTSPGHTQQGQSDNSQDDAPY